MRLVSSYPIAPRSYFSCLDAVVYNAGTTMERFVRQAGRVNVGASVPAICRRVRKRHLLFGVFIKNGPW